MEEVKARFKFFMATSYSNKIMLKAMSNPEKKLGDLIENDKPIFKDLLHLLYITSNFGMRKEDTIEEINNQYWMKINKEHVEALIKKIADTTNEDGSVVIEGVLFDSTADVINTIRNKFSHGRHLYFPDECTSNINVNRKTILLSLDWLMVFDRLTFLDVHKLKNDGNYYEGIIKVKANNFDHIDSYQNFKKIFVKLKYFEFVVTPKKANIVYKDYENLQISQYISEITEDFNKFENYDAHLRSLKKYCDNHDLNLEVNIIPLSNFSEEEKNKLKQAYLTTKDFSSIDKGGQLRKICEWITDIKHIRTTPENNSVGYVAAHDFVDCINSGVSYADFCRAYPNYALFFEKSYISILLAHFNIMYVYNAEVFYDEYLDYSKLDLSSVNPSINKFEDQTLISLNKEIDILKRQTDKSLSNLIKIKANLDSFLLSKKSINKEAQAKIVKNVGDAKNQYNSLKEKLDEIELQKQSREKEINDNKTYYDNKNIITHIRNSLAHGNFEIDSVGKGESIGHILLNVKDIYEGEKTFEASLTIQDFYKIMFGNNECVINEAYLEIAKKIMAYESSNGNKDSFFKRMK